jgi:hypothetical protein
LHDAELQDVVVPRVGEERVDGVGVLEGLTGAGLAGVGVDREVVVAATSTSGSPRGTGGTAGNRRPQGS